MNDTAGVAGEEQECQTAASDTMLFFQHNDPFLNANPDDEMESCGGAGTIEVLEVTRLGYLRELIFPAV